MSNETAPTNREIDPNLCNEFAGIYTKHKREIINFLRYRLPNPSHAEDLAQEVFYQALRRFQDFENRGIPYSAYLYTVAARTASNWSRKRSNTNETPFSDRFPPPAESLIGNSADLNPSPWEMEEENLWRQICGRNLGIGNAVRKLEDQLIRREKIDDVRSALSKLKPYDRSMIEFRYYEDLSIAEIANIVGKTESIKLLIVGLLTNGHILIEDVPGVGKTMLALSLAKSINGEFKRIQFTPDLLPSDVTGGFIYNQKNRNLNSKKGLFLPIFF